MSGPIVGIDIGGTKMLMLAGARSERVATGAVAEIGDLEAAIAGFVAKLPLPPAAIGVAVPGLVDTAGAVVACDVLPRIVGWRPGSPAGIAVFVLNDAEAALIEDAADLPADATAAVVMVGTGIGAAFMAAGRVLRGADGWAGELGGIPMGTAAGNLDQLASGAAILRRLGMEAQAVRGRAEAGDAAVLDALREAGTALGLGLATVINLLNPRRVSLGGGTLAMPGYAEAAIASARANSLPELWRACELRPSPRGDQLVALGAARHAARQLSPAAPRSAASR